MFRFDRGKPENPIVLSETWLYAATLVNLKPLRSNLMSQDQSRFGVE